MKLTKALFIAMILTCSGSIMAQTMNFVAMNFCTIKVGDNDSLSSDKKRRAKGVVKWINLHQVEQISLSSTKLIITVDSKKITIPNVPSNKIDKIINSFTNCSKN